MNWLQRNSKPSKQKIVIVSTCEDDWGGCEDLWSKSIPYLQAAGYSIAVYKKKINRRHAEYVKLADKAVELIELNSHKKFISRVWKRITDKIRRKDDKDDKNDLPVLVEKLLKCNPRLVIMSQSINFDGLYHANVCRKLHIPYVIVSQKAVDFYWPESHERQLMKEAFKNSLHCFFVSQHNFLLTEEQFGMRFNNASVIFNPVRVKEIIPYPKDTQTLRLACVGRLFLLDKGQDILLRILAKEKWRERNLSVSFIGVGRDETGLKEMAHLLGISNIDFKGEINDFESICCDHHAFILPSRSEGLPLVLVEAMTAGRVVIASNAGGNAEIIDEGVTGYSGFANEEAFDRAMERAWTNRDQWQLMGEKAGEHIRKIIPHQPDEEFARKIIIYANK